MNRRLYKALLCAGLVVTAVPTASASSLSMIRQVQTAFVDVAVEGVGGGLIEGEFKWNRDPETPAGYDDTFYGYAVDTRKALVNGDMVAIRSTDLLTVVGVADAGGKAAWLFNGYSPGIRRGAGDRRSHHETAALQVAIWEALLDASGDLSTGAMKVASDGGLKQKAKSYLAALYDPDGSYRTGAATWLDLAGGSEPISLPGVPEPGTLLMIGTGLGLALAIRRRRHHAASA